MPARKDLTAGLALGGGGTQTLSPVISEALQQRRGMACVFSSHARTALVVGVLLLLVLCSQQGLARHVGGQAFTGQEVQMASAPKAASSTWLQLMHRAARSTPLWRTLGSKPLGAFCKRGLECSTHTCWKGHCEDPQVKS